MRDVKYLLAWLLPASAGLALWGQGPWVWSTVVLAFVIIPAVELWTPASTANFSGEEEQERLRRRFFDWLLYLNLPVVYGLAGWLFAIVSTASLGWADLTGLCLSLGIIIGANGINVAHELGHRSKPYEQHLAKLLLLPALYQHFFIEHNRGHHRYVATDRDPASARFGENVYGFWIRSVAGSWRSAWQLERERLRKDGLSVWSLHNQMLRFQLYQAAYLLAVYFIWGTPALLAAIAIAATGFLLLETINYIEHYGLRRKILESGRPEPVGPQHSWNSNHELGRIFLYELTRHSDHHYRASRKYQILRHFDQSPQLPFGYPTSIVLALAPPLWFRIMNPKARALQET